MASEVTFQACCVEGFCDVTITMMEDGWQVRCGDIGSFVQRCSFRVIGEQVMQESTEGPPKRHHNAAWLGVEWVNEVHAATEIAALATGLRSRHIGTAYVYTTYLHDDGTFNRTYQHASDLLSGLKAAYPEIVIAGVLPTDDPRIEWVRSRAVHGYLRRFGVPEMRFLIEDILDQELLDHEIVVKNEDAKHMADRLCSEEGLFCGMSSGANVVAAIELGKMLKPGSKIVTVLVDRRDRYYAEFPHEHYVV